MYFGYPQLRCHEHHVLSAAEGIGNTIKEIFPGKNNADSLRSLEADGIVSRTVYPEVPPRVEYALSELGETIRPILDAMAVWGANYKEHLTK